MGTLYLDHHQMELRVQGGALELRLPKGVGGDDGAPGGSAAKRPRPRTIPLSLLERVVAHGEVQLTTSVLGRLAEAGIGVLVLSQRQSWRTACLLGRPHRDLRLRLAQYQLALDGGGARIHWARLWVRGKLRAQLRELRHARRLRPDREASLTGALTRLTPLCERLAPSDPPAEPFTGDRAPSATPGPEAENLTIESLRGIEGAAANIYFRALTTLFAPALGFQGRNRRPPRDPVNAALSLAYTLLHFEAVRAAHAAGLDPLIGSLHEPAYGRESLACDFIEPLRPRVDGWIWRLFQDRVLRLEHFSMDKGACLLHKTGRRHFYEAWEDAAHLVRPALRGYGRLYAAHLRGMALPLAPVAAEWDEYALGDSLSEPDAGLGAPGRKPPAGTAEPEAEEQTA